MVWDLFFLFFFLNQPVTGGFSQPEGVPPLWIMMSLGEASLTDGGRLCGIRCCTKDKNTQNPSGISTFCGKTSPYSESIQTGLFRVAGRGFAYLNLRMDPSSFWPLFGREWNGLFSVGVLMRPLCPWLLKPGS